MDEQKPEELIKKDEIELIRETRLQLKAEMDALEAERLRAEQMRAEQILGGKSLMSQELNPDDEKKKAAAKFFEGTQIAKAIQKHG